MVKSKVKPIKRNNSEYGIFRKKGNVPIRNGFNNMRYVEYTIMDEMYKRTKSLRYEWDDNAGNWEVYTPKKYKGFHTTEQLYSLYQKSLNK
jgi:hypothetical protein